MEQDFHPNISSVIRLAKSMAANEKHQTYGVAHLALALLYEPTGLSEILRSLQKDETYIQEWFEVRKERYESEAHTDASVLPDSQVTNIFDEAERSKIKLGTDQVDAICLFTAILREGVIFNRSQLGSITVSEEDFLNLYHAAEPLTLAEDTDLNATLSKLPYCQNLHLPKTIEAGEIVVGRNAEIRTILENLERQENRGVLIIGDPGVGKTAVIEALVYYISQSENPSYQSFQIIGLNSSKLLARAGSPSEVTKKLSEVFDQVKKLEDTILVIDDIHILTESANNSGTITNLISGELSEGGMHFIATITADAYRKTIEKHPITRKLDGILLEELDSLSLEKCLENHRLRFIAHYQLKIDPLVVTATLNYSKRYFKERKLPYGAIELLDKTMAAVQMSNHNSPKDIYTLLQQLKTIKNSESDALSKLQYCHKQLVAQISPILLSKVDTNYNFEKIEQAKEFSKNLKSYLKEIKHLTIKPLNVVTEAEITAMVAHITNIPIGKIQAEEKDRLLRMETKLQERVKGQDHAINTLADAIIESRSGLSNPKQPIGSFFFLGPTGTGKTELTKALAQLLFDDENALIRFDMSEFKEEHSAALLYGAPPGYVGYEEGGMLVNKIRQKPYSVVLFDEIEKAHQSVYDVFLQIMDEGQIHDKLGREGDFSNSIIIFTSNIGSDWIASQIRSGKIPASNDLIDVMSNHFRPEFLGRLTEVVPFGPIDEEVANMIFNLHLQRLQEQLLEQKEITLQVTPEATSYLSKKGYSEKYGARPIAGVIRSYIKKAISRLIVSETIANGDVVELNFKEEQLIWEKINR